jgi:hypothetical protein
MKGIFLFATASMPALRITQLPIRWVLGNISLRVMRPGREADHSPPSSGKIKNVWSYTSTPPYVFIAWCLINQRIRVQGVLLSQDTLLLYLHLRDWKGIGSFLGSKGLCKLVPEKVKKQREFMFTSKVMMTAPKVSFHCPLSSDNSVTRLTWLFHWHKAPNKKINELWPDFEVNGYEKCWNLRKNDSSARRQLYEP